LSRGGTPLLEKEEVGEVNCKLFRIHPLSVINYQLLFIFEIIEGYLFKNTILFFAKYYRQNGIILKVYLANCNNFTRRKNYE